MRKLTSISIASVIAISSSMVFATDTTTTYGHTGSPTTSCDHHKKHSGNPFSHLNLTAEQKSKMKELMRTIRTNSKEMYLPNMETMRKIIISDKFDETLAKQQAEKLVAQRVEAMKVKHEMYQLLTTEQKKEFNENYQQRMKKRQHKQND